MPIFKTPNGLSPVWALAAKAFYEDYDHVGWRSVTTLCDSPRVHILEERHEDAIQYSIDEYIDMLEGNVLHDILSRVGRTDDAILVEDRVTHMFHGKEISFKPDRVVKLRGTTPSLYKVQDYKRCKTGVWMYGGRSSWTAQLNVYRMLLQMQLKIIVAQLAVEARFSNWNRMEAVKRNYPPKPVMPFKVELWDIASTEQFLIDRIELYQEVEDLPDTELPFCTEAERWNRPDTFAVKKKGRKKAYRTYTSRSQAERCKSERTNPNEYEIEFRPGESVRCQYCKVKPWCNQYHTVINPPF